MACSLPSLDRHGRQQCVDAARLYAPHAHNLARGYRPRVIPRRRLRAGQHLGGIDDAIGRVLHALEQSGRRDETVVMFTSDHGDHLGNHRLLLKGAEQYQSIVRVPFIWCDPQAADYAAVADTLASTLDISATVLDRARVEPFSGIQGRSLLPALRGAGAVRESVFIQYDHQHPSPGTEVAPRVHSLIDRRYRISVFHGTGWGELYDLEADPGEFENLWEDPAHASTRARMVEQLLIAEIEYVDRVPLPTRRA